MLPTSSPTSRLGDLSSACHGGPVMTPFAYSTRYFICHNQAGVLAYMVDNVKETLGTVGEETCKTCTAEKLVNALTDSLAELFTAKPIYRSCVQTGLQWQHCKSQGVADSVNIC